MAVIVKGYKHIKNAHPVRCPPGVLSFVSAAMNFLFCLGKVPGRTNLSLRYRLFMATNFNAMNKTAIEIHSEIWSAPLSMKPFHDDRMKTEDETEFKKSYGCCISKEFAFATY